jgi:hypothetical protein
VSIAGVGVGAPRIEGLVLSGAAAGATVMRGVVVAPAYFRIDDAGRLTGLSVSAYNHIKGEQRGLAIGIFNYARSLNGVQIGVLNYAGNNSRGRRLLPLVNLHVE